MNDDLISQLETSLNTMKFGKLQWKLFFLCGMGWAADMMWIVGTAIIMNEVGDEWNVPISQRSALPFSLMLGVFIGSYVWGTISDKKGRMLPYKRTLLVSVLAGSVGCASVDIWMLSVCFFCAGLGLGGNLAVDGAVFIEYCPSKCRHMLTGMSIICVFGSILVCGCSWWYLALGCPQMWRILLATIVLVTFTSAVFRFSIKETPHFLISKGRVAEAEIVISEMLAYNGDEKMTIPLTTIQQRDESIHQYLDIKGQIKVLLSPPFKGLLLCYVTVLVNLDLVFHSFYIFWVW